jgi:hypothetical protein
MSCASRSGVVPRPIARGALRVVAAVAGCDVSRAHNAQRRTHTRRAFISMSAPHNIHVYDEPYAHQRMERIYETTEAHQDVLYMDIRSNQDQDKGVYEEPVVRSAKRDNNSSSSLARAIHTSDSSTMGSHSPPVLSDHSAFALPRKHRSVDVPIQLELKRNDSMQTPDIMVQPPSPRPQDRSQPPTTDAPASRSRSPSPARPTGVSSPPHLSPDRARARPRSPLPFSPVLPSTPSPAVRTLARCVLSLSLFRLT